MERTPCIHIARASGGEPWLLRHVGSDRAPWPYVQLRDAVEDARRCLASAGGGDLVVDEDGEVSATHVDGDR